MNAERIRLLYAHSPFVFIGVIVISAVTCVMFWNSAARDGLMVWFASIAALTGARFLAGKQFNASFDPDGSNTLYWAVISSIGALLSGIMWGLLPWLILDVNSIFNVLSITLILFGMVASAVGSHASYPVVYFCYSIPVVGLLAVRIAMEGGDYLYLSGLLFVFLIVNLGYSISQYHMITRSIKQRFENMGLLKDLEEKKSEAEKANEDKSRFLAATSHDLRQPLHALDLLLGVMDVELGDSGQSKLKHLLSRAKHSSHALGELLNALLDVSRLDAGDVLVNCHVIDLRIIMREIVDECRGQFEAEGRELRLRVLPVMVESDPVLLLQILRNLVVNTIRHTDGNVLMGARKRGDWIRIEVWDQGDGLEEDNHERIFSEFFQLKNPERDRSKGLGLGLAIVRKISDLLNHPVGVRSRLGQGCCFSVDVPYLSMEMLQPLTQSTHAGADVSGIFALVVDDEEAIREGMVLLLRSWACEVLTAASGDEALHELRANDYPPPDVLILDYRLRGGETGEQVAQQVYDLFGKKIPTMIITGDTDPEIGARCRRMRCSLLRKPVGAESLKTALAELVGLSCIPD